MKITDIQIEQYGIWRHLALPLRSGGLNVFYGPNEAGKTTLLRFIRDVLYGEQPRESLDQTSHPGESAWDGSLRITEGDRFGKIRRWSHSDGTQGVAFQDLDPALAWQTEPEWAAAEPSETLAGEPAETAIEEWLAGTNARLFRHVFAIGLNELQVLATLHDDEVAREIYALSLGPEGRNLLKVSGQLQGMRGFLPEHQAQIARWMKRDAQLRQELEEYASQRDRHAELNRLQSTLEARQKELEQQHAQLQQQLTAHETLQRVWEPWNQVREYETQLNALPSLTVSDIDPGRLKQLESEIRELTRKYKSQIAQAKGLKQQIEAVQKQHTGHDIAAEIKGFLHQRPWVAELEREVELANAREREFKTEFEAHQQALGADWPVHRLAAIDTTPGAYPRLVDAAHALETAQARQNALRKRYEKTSAACHQRQAELDRQLESLPEASLDEALEVTRQQWESVEELSRLQAQANELQQRLAGQQQEFPRRESSAQVPSWVPGFLLFLAISGLTLSAMGFYTSLTSNGIGGAILGLVGIAGFAIARAFPVETEEADETSADEIAPIREVEDSLAAVQEAMDEIAARDWVVEFSAEELAEETSTEMLSARLSQRLAELRRLENRQRRLRSRRRRLSRMRKALQTRQRDVAQARQGWCDVLKQSGLQETLGTSEAKTTWRNVTVAVEKMRAWDAAREAAARVMERYEAFCHHLADFGQRLGHHQLDYNNPLHVLAHWETELVSLGQETGELRRLKQELRELRRSARRIKQKILAARAERTALLAQVGASNQAEFEQRLSAAQRRQEIQELLELAKLDLSTLSESDPELAIVEEDLLRFNAEQNQESIDLLTMELEDLTSQIEETKETIEQVRQDLADLESDRRPAVLRAEREAIASRLRQCLQQQAARKLGTNIVQKIRGEYEETCQPAILEVASEYLAQLTCGKYQRIWTRLGEQNLRVTDEDQQNLLVEQLSTGTREQLFLALRLGLVNEFSQRGIALPMVLDDVLVNFDHSRTEAAVETLLEFTERGHQVLLLTSHLHVAKLSEQRGIDPVWLPAHHTLPTHRRAG